MKILRFNPDGSRETPESLVAAAQAELASASAPYDAHFQKAFALVARAEQGCVRIPPSRAASVGRMCQQIREAMKNFAKTGSQGEAKRESVPVRIPRLHSPVFLSPEEMEERVEDVSAEILSSGSQLRGGSLRLEARKLLGQAGFRVKT